MVTKYTKHTMSRKCHFLRRHLFLYLNGSFIFTATLYYKGWHHLWSTLCPIRYSQLWQMGHPAKACQNQYVPSVTVDCTWWDERFFLGDVNNSKSLVILEYFNGVHDLRTTLCPIRYSRLLLMGQPFLCFMGWDGTTCQSRYLTGCPFSHSWLYLMGQMCILVDVINSNSIVQISYYISLSLHYIFHSI